VAVHAVHVFPGSPTLNKYYHYHTGVSIVLHNIVQYSHSAKCPLKVNKTKYLQHTLTF